MMSQNRELDLMPRTKRSGWSCFQCCISADDNDENEAAEDLTNAEETFTHCDQPVEKHMTLSSKREGDEHNTNEVEHRAGKKLLGGQKALVTGASSGIGKAIAIAMGQAGAYVAVNFKDNNTRRDADEVCKEIQENHGQAKAFKANVAKEKEVKEMFKKILDEKDGLGTIDILVNNAGIQSKPDKKLHQLKLDEWQDVINVNLTGQFLCAREAINVFMERNKKNGVSRAAGKIICMSSVHDAMPWAGQVPYCASKGGVMLMMKTLAQEVAPYGIRVNCISPGAIKTDINRHEWDNPEKFERVTKLIPQGRWGETEDVARAAVWLASDEADYINGTTLYIDGGVMVHGD